MRIQNNISNLNFDARLNTADVLEVTSMRIFKNDGIIGIKQVVDALEINPNKATGWRGYKYFSQIAGKRICKKYPQISQATQEIKSWIDNNPYITKKELNEKVSPIIEKIGETIDIEL